jgi:hypothetical protein
VKIHTGVYTRSNTYHQHSLPPLRGMLGVLSFVPAGTPARSGLASHVVCLFERQEPRELLDHSNYPAKTRSSFTKELTHPLESTEITKSTRECGVAKTEILMVPGKIRWTNPGKTTIEATKRPNSLCEISPEAARLMSCW